MSELFVSPPLFLFQVWPDLERNQYSADHPGELLHPLTCLCFFLLFLGRLFLPALPFLFMLLLLCPSFSSRCSSRSPSLSPLMIWCSGQTAPFLFVLARAAPAYLPTAHFVALRPLFLFQQAQYAQVFLLNPAPFCMLFAGLGSTNKSATSVLLLSDSRSVLATMSSLHLSFYLKLSARSGRNCLLSPPVLSGYNGSPDTRFSWGTTRLRSWPDGERYLRPLQSLVVSLVLSLVSTLFFSRTGSILSI